MAALLHPSEKLHFFGIILGTFPCAIWDLGNFRIKQTLKSSSVSLSKSGFTKNHAKIQSSPVWDAEMHYDVTAASAAEKTLDRELKQKS